MTPSRAPRLRRVLAIALAAAAPACSIGASGSFPSLVTARPAQDVPERFAPADSSLLLVPGDTIAGDGCRSPMRDPRDGTTLTMQRAQGGYADYEVPAGRYGVGDDELLRLVCNTGLVAGVVPR